MKTRRFRYRVPIAVILLCLLITSCDQQREKKNGLLTVVTTTGMIRDAVQNIVGDKAKVVSLMGPGVDPHLYKASHGDLEKITGADVIFYNGLHLEGKMGKVLEKASRIKPVVAVASAIPDKRLRRMEEFESSHDPHICFDVMLWKEAVQNISVHLQKHDSANASFYIDNTNRYVARLDSLHAAVKESMTKIPQSQRVLITAHDAFGYFGDAYGVEVRGLQGISTLSEFGLRDVTDLVNFIIQRKIKAIFVETSVSEKSIQAILEGCRERGWNVVIGGSLYSDALGDDNTPEGTYIGMVDANVRTIVGALK